MATIEFFKPKNPENLSEDELLVIQLTKEISLNEEENAADDEKRIKLIEREKQIVDYLKAKERVPANTLKKLEVITPEVLKSEEDRDQKTIPIAEKPKKGMDRREFLVKTGKVAAILAAGGVLGTASSILEDSTKRKNKGISTKKSVEPTQQAPVDTIKTETPLADTVKVEESKVDSAEIKRLEEKRKAEELVAEQKEKFGALYEKMDMHFYNEVLDDVGRLVYLYRVTNQQEQKEHPGYWLMLDKRTTKLHIIDGDNKLAHTRGVLIGSEVGDELNDEDVDGHLSTPPVFTTISNQGISEYFKKKYGQHLWRVENTSAFEGEAIYIHGPIGAKGEKEAFASNKAEDHRKSHGCIRNPNIVDDEKHWHADITRIAILPENKGVILNPETKKTELSKSADLKERIQSVIDKYR